MTYKHQISIFVLSTVGLAAPLFAESGNKKLVHLTTTQQLPFQAGGTLHIDRAFGELSVEGWDRPELELTVTKSPNELYSAKEQDQAAKLAENVKVTAERKSDSEMAISTTVSHFSRWTRPFGPMGRIMLDYRIRVPRNTKLVIHSDNGQVLVSGVVADIEATGNAGGIVLLLPEAEKYSIDAKTKLGSLTSDFDGDFQRSLMGHTFTETAPAPAHKIYLRMGRGGIEIKGSPAAAQPPVTAGSQ